MNKKQLAEILKYSSPRTLYVVTWNNLLKKLFCPFRVKVLYNIGELKKGQIVLVDKIKVTEDVKTVFIIKVKAYYYHHFEILV